MVLRNVVPSAVLRCVTASEVRETRAGRDQGRVVSTPGAFIEVVYPEQSSVAYVWTIDTFTAVWTSD